MKPTYPFILFLVVLHLALSGYGQCTPNIYYLDSDGDGFGTMVYEQADISLAMADWIDSGSPENAISIAENVAYGGNIPNSDIY